MSKNCSPGPPKLMNSLWCTTEFSKYLFLGWECAGDDGANTQLCIPQGQWRWPLSCLKLLDGMTQAFSVSAIGTAPYGQGHYLSVKPSGWFMPRLLQCIRSPIFPLELFPVPHEKRISAQVCFLVLNALDSFVFTALRMAQPYNG